MKINHLSFHFASQVIFDDTDFESVDSGITIVLGKSGSGKSTLLNLISSRLESDSSLMIDINTISYATQNPVFIENQSMKNHIAILESIYHRPFDMNMIDLLNLSESLHHYPKSLSGGEGQRWQIAFALYEQKDCLLCDEPTASLDWKQKEHLLEYMKEYARNGHQIIITTHDTDLLSYADKIYEIKEKKLVIKKDNTTQDKTNQSSNNYLPNIDLKKIQKITAKNLDYHFTGRFFKKLFFSLSIICICLGLIYNENVLQLNEMYSYQDINNELIVYKTLGGIKNKKLSYFGYEKGFTQEEVDYLNRIEHVTSVSYGYMSDYCSFLLLENNDITVNDKNSLSLIEPVTNMVIPLFKESNYYGGGTTVASYSKSQEEMFSLSSQFNVKEPGVYITHSFYEFIKYETNIESLNGYRLKLSVPVPIYKVCGPTFNDGQTYINGKYLDFGLPVFPQCGIYVDIELEIEGIIEGDKFLSYDIFNDITLGKGFFIPEEIIKNFVKEYTDENSHVIYQVYDKENRSKYYSYFDELPQENYDIKIDLQPYMGDYLILKLDSVLNINKVTSELENLNLGVLNEIDTRKTNLIVAYAYQHSLIFLGLMMLVISIITVAISAILSQPEIQNTLLFYKSHHCNEKELKRIKRMLFDIEFKELLLLTFALLAVILISLVLTSYFPFEFRNLIIIPIIFGICYLYEIMIPSLIGGVFK